MTRLTTSFAVTPTLCPGRSIVPARTAHTAKRNVMLVPRMALAPPPPRPPVQDLPHSEQPWCAQVVGRDALEDILISSGDAFVVVCFVANWCRVCRTLLSKVRRLSDAHPELVFATVDFAHADNKPLCSSLGVKLLPTFHFYRGAREAADFTVQFTAGPFGIKRLIERLAECEIFVSMPKS